MVKSNPWIKFKATAISKCPVPSGTVVDVDFANGLGLRNERAYRFDWKEHGVSSIIKYRKTNKPRKPLAKKPRSNSVSELTEPHANDGGALSASEYIANLTQPLPNSPVSRTLAADTSERDHAENSSRESSEVTPQGVYYTEYDIAVIKSTSFINGIQANAQDERSVFWKGFRVGLFWCVITAIIMIEVWWLS